MTIENSSASSHRTSDSVDDCFSLLLFLVLLSCITTVAFGRHITNLMASEIPGETTLPTALIGLGVQTFFTLTPTALLAFFWPRAEYRSFFQSWALATLLPLFLAPGYLLAATNMQGQIVLQSFSVMIFIGLLLGIAHKRTHRSEASQTDPTTTPSASNWTNELLLLLIASVFVTPWMISGALGSLLDTLLQAFFSLLLGVAAALLTELFLCSPTRNFSPLRGGYFIASLGIGVNLLLLASALSFSFGGIQLLLMLALPALGWPLSLVAGLSNPHGKPGTFGYFNLRRFIRLTLFISLVTFLPLAFIDPDELVLVASLGDGEILNYAIGAVLINVGWAFFIGLGLYTYVSFVRWRWSTKSVAANLPSKKNLNIEPSPTITNPEFPHKNRSQQLAFAVLTIIFTFGLWLFSLRSYFTQGKPGFYGERYFVILKSQADLASIAKTMPNYDQRRSYVYQTLVKHANQTQTNLRSSLDKWGIDYTPYYLINAIEVEGNPFLRLWLLSQPEVDRILDSPRMRPLPKLPPISAGDLTSLESTPLWNQKLIHADRVWRELKVTGEGIIVGQSDSGAQSEHSELKDQYRGRDGDQNYNWFDPWNSSDHPIDFGGHGTHTLGSILGKHVGIAPNATWIACTNLARNLGNPALYLDCWQFMLAPFPLNGDPFIDGRPELGAQVLNNSWGCPELEGCDANTFLDAVRALQAAGIFIVVSAGNDGPMCNTLNTPPAIYAEVFSVGAVDQWGNLAYFSSIGPVTADGSQRVKPDILAPGVEVFSSMPGSTYAKNSGTSMAGPHVVGVVVLMWSANPTLIGDIERTTQILRETAQPYSGYLPDCPNVDAIPSTASGYGIVDAYAAVQQALKEP